MGARVGQGGAGTGADPQNAEPGHPPLLPEPFEVLGGARGAEVQFAPLELVGAGLCGVGEGAAHLGGGGVGAAVRQSVEGAAGGEGQARAGRAGPAPVVDDDERPGVGEFGAGGGEPRREGVG